MAFGDLVQSGKASFANTATFSQTATTGNLLVVALSNTSGETVTAAPSGFSPLTEGGDGDQRFWFGYKVSDGTETAASVTFSGGDDGTLVYKEFDTDGLSLVTPIPAPGSDESYSTDKGQYAAGATPASASNIVIAALNVRVGGAWGTGETVSAPFTRPAGLEFPAGGAEAGVTMAYAVNQSGLTTATWDTGDGNQDGAAYTYDFSFAGAADTTDPAETAPEVVTQTRNITATYDFTDDSGGNVTHHAVITPLADSAPTTAEVLAGQVSGGGSAPAGDYQTATVASGASAALTFASKELDTAYRVSHVAIDASGNDTDVQHDTVSATGAGGSSPLLISFGNGGMQ